MSGVGNSDIILTRLSALHPKLIDLSLDRIRDLLDRLDRPQDHLPPVVHVAGTNGKGSVIAMLRAICAAADLRVHSYVSPHLVRFAERIRLAGRTVGEAPLIRALEHCEAVNAGRPITLFEITTAAAFTLFARRTADILLLETGLGGRLDATNVVAAPALSVITPISHDHQQFLGERLESIAAEKAAIQKPGTPCVIGAQEPAAGRVIADYGAQIGAPQLCEGRDWQVTPRADGSFDFHSPDWTGHLPRPALAGGHQIGNAGIAVAAALTLRRRGFPLADRHLAAGLRRARWPGRLQRLRRGPFVTGMPGWGIHLDGGHNPAAGRMLAATARDWAGDDAKSGAGRRPLVIVCGMLNNKDSSGFLAALGAVADAFLAVPIPGESNGRTPDELAALAREAGFARVQLATHLDEAPACLSRLAAEYPPGRVLICGSLYLAGAVLANHG